MIKYGMIGATVIFTIHCGLLVVGYSPMLTEPIVGVSWYWGVLLFLSLCALRFCRLVKSMYLYVFVMSRLIVEQRLYAPFGGLLMPLRVLMLAVGIVLLAAFVLKHGKDCPTGTSAVPEQ